MQLQRGAGRSSGARPPGRIDLLPGGAWYRSEFVAGPVTIANDAIVDIDTLIPGQTYPVFYFLQDHPTTNIAFSAYPPGILAPAGLEAPNYLEDARQVGTRFGTLLSSTELATYDRKERMVGVTATNGVAVSGYFSKVEIGDRGYQVAGPVAATVGLRLNVSCAAAVQDGDADYQSALVGVTNYSCVLLDETVYTQAMFDAGNVIEVPDGSNDFYIIVGLLGAPAA